MRKPKLQIAWIDNRVLYSLPNGRREEVERFGEALKRMKAGEELITNYEMEIVNDYPEDMQQDLLMLSGDQEFVKELKKLILIHKL